MLSLRFATKVPSWFNALPVDSIIGFTMAAMGLSIVAFPKTAILSVFQSAFSMDGQILGVILVFCAMGIMTKPSLVSFLVLTFPFLFYVLLAIAYVLQSPNVSPVFLSIYVGYYLLILKVYQVKEQHNGRRE